MAVSAGPYKKIIPFATIQEVEIMKKQSQSPSSLYYAAGQQFGVMTAAEEFRRTAELSQAGISFLRSNPGGLPDPVNKWRIKVQISNGQRSQPTNTVKFGNFIHFGTVKNAIIDLKQDPADIKYLIRNANNKYKRMFSLQAPDFQLTPIVTSLQSQKYVHSYVFSDTFDVPMSSNLYMMVVAFREYKNEITIGNIICETLLEENKTPLNSSLYKLKQSMGAYGAVGTTWPGSAHIEGNELMVGNSHMTSTDHPTLRRHHVPNIKVKDLRVAELAKELSPAFTPPIGPGEYISPLQTSRGSNGKGNGMFSFNMLSFIANNSALKGVMTNQESLLASVELDDIIIYGKKSNGSMKGNSLTPVPGISCGINKTEGYKKVASLGDGCEILNTSQNPGIFDVSFVDNSIVELSNGFVEYKVEMVMADRSKEIIQGVLREINKQLDIARGSLGRPGRVPVRAGIEGALHRDRSLSFERLITAYLLSLKYLFGPNTFEPFTQAYWKNNLLSLAYNTQNDLSQKRKVLDVVAGFAKKLNAFARNDFIATWNAQPTTLSYASQIYHSKRETPLTFINEFNNKLSIQGGVNVGAGYIEHNISGSSNAIPTVSFENYLARVNQELIKFNIDDSTDINKYGYLTPAFIGFNATAVVDTTNFETSTNQFLPFINAALDENQVLDIQGTENDPLATLKILQSSGVSIVPLATTLTTTVIAEEVADAQPVDASDFLSADSNFYLGGLDAAGSQESNIQHDDRHPPWDSGLATTLVNATITSFTTQDTLTNHEMIQNSVPLASFMQNLGIIAESDPMTVLLNYGSIVQVQYLNVYEEGDSVRDQKWQLLNENKFEKARVDNQPLLCRLVQLSTTVAVNPQLVLKPLTSLFVLGSVGASSLVTRSGQAASVPALTSGQGASNVSIILNYGDEMVYSTNIPMIGDS